MIIHNIGGKRRKIGKKGTGGKEENSGRGRRDRDFGQSGMREECLRNGGNIELTLL